MWRDDSGSLEVPASRAYEMQPARQPHRKLPCRAGPRGAATWSNPRGWRGGQTGATPTSSSPCGRGAPCVSVCRVCVCVCVSLCLLLTLPHGAPTSLVSSRLSPPSLPCTPTAPLMFVLPSSGCRVWKEAQSTVSSSFMCFAVWVS